MNSSCCIKLVLVTFLVAILLHDGFAEITDYQKKVFGARQSEAKRNRIKYNPCSKEGVPFFTGFLVKDNFREFLLPTLSDDDKLEQTFTTLGESFHLLCRKLYHEHVVDTQQWNAIHALNKGKPYLYSSVPTDKSAFKFVPPPVSSQEEEILQHKRILDYFCAINPMPGLKLVQENNKIMGAKFGSKNLKYKYGEEQKTCNYFQLGVETLPSDDSNEEKSKAQKLDLWAPLFDVCHDPTNSVTAFTKHTINWKHLKHRKLNPNISVIPHEEKIFVGQDYDQYYDLKNQEESFKASECRKEKMEFDTESNYLVRARLVPEYDSLYEGFQYITRNYINYVPQWRSVNMGQWLKVEQDIRSVALKVQKDLTVYTGAYYTNRSTKLIIPVEVVKEEEEEDDENISIWSKTTVESKSIPIPSAFFKYVYTDKAGIVIITANGVSGSTKDIRCRNVCHTYGWVYQDKNKRHRNTVSRGQTKCCIPDEFFILKEIKNSLPSLPAGVHTRTKILTSYGQEVENFQKLIENFRTPYNMEEDEEK